MRKIIDISKFNRITNWKKVKNNVDGIIIRVAYRGYGSGKIVKDEKFDEFAKACNQYEIPWGMYFMSSAISEREAIEEAEYSIKQAMTYCMPKMLPIFIDSEDVDGTPAKRRSDALTNEQRTNVIAAFVKRVHELGYTGGIYCSDSWTRDMLHWCNVKDLGFNWIAKYGKNDGTISPIQAKPCHMHQFTSRASIPGIAGKCDLSVYYSNFSKDSKPVIAETSKHVQLNYRQGKQYKVNVSSILNVRTKKLNDNINLIPNGKKIGSLKNGEIVTCYAAGRVGDAIWMYIGDDRAGREQWICADTGTKAYVIQK